MDLLRMMTVWDSAASDLDTNSVVTGKGVSSVRVSEGAFGRIITVLTTQLTLDEVSSQFVQIKRAGCIRCRSLKLFFNGKIPEKLLLEKGLHKKGPLWKLPHNEISILAVPFGANEWCFMIEKRTGHGVPTHALSYLPYYDYQLQLEVEIG
ncbi:hypothetical protein [Cytobacillus firmus]|uniref:Uncharacterized protein n=1 Tax=Cytobacillus firmus DS1 TaxID=1307436 RepID=W7KPF9_CYTFI|nr:hypothetical protein [Cytobacillus firmus]EWG09350.1 hypothetical protein PBF_19678 [Cytobacillus firmus DS1]